MLLFFTLDVNKDKNTGKLELGYCYVTMLERMKNYLSCCLFSVNERAIEREGGREGERERESIRCCTHINNTKKVF